MHFDQVPKIHETFPSSTRPRRHGFEGSKDNPYVTCMQMMDLPRKKVFEKKVTLKAGHNAFLVHLRFMPGNFFSHKWQKRTKKGAKRTKIHKN